MSYFETIKNLTANISTELVDFSQERIPANAPTQASSNFITNKEQGDWAENLIMRAINDASHNYIAVHYGKNDDLVAGDEGFDTFYQEFQNELDTIGKRPDLLIFKKSDFRTDLGLDISKMPHCQIDDYVKKAIAGIEVRSSAFLIDKYEKSMSERTEQNIARAMELKNDILSSCLLNHSSRSKYINVLNSINPETIHIADFKVPGWRSTSALIELNNKLKELKNCIKEIQKRDYLSITPKVEDIKVVYKWIETFNVPHYYFQVFFDKIYGISFEQILSIISDSDNEGSIFSIEQDQDTKNQNKTTIKIRSNAGYEIAYKVDEPCHNSVRKEMNRGRLLFYVSFQGGTAYLDLNNLKSILNIEDKEF